MANTTINLRFYVIALRITMFSHLADQDYSMDSSAQHYKKKSDIMKPHNLQKNMRLIMLDLADF